MVREAPLQPEPAGPTRSTCLPKPGLLSLTRHSSPRQTDLREGVDLCGPVRGNHGSSPLPVPGGDKETFHFVLPGSRSWKSLGCQVAQDSFLERRSPAALLLRVCPEFQVRTTCVVYSFGEHVNIRELTEYHILNQAQGRQR